MTIDFEGFLALAVIIIPMSLFFAYIAYDQRKEKKRKS